MTANDKYSLFNRGNLLQHFQIQLYQNWKIFSNFFDHFWHSDSILNISKKKMTLIADVFLNLRTGKNVVRWMSRKSSFRGPFDKWHAKQAETLLELERQHLYHIYWSLWRQFRLRKHLWVICKILGLFVNPFTVNDKYCLLNRGDLLQHFQIQLSKKQKVLSECFLDFLNLNPIFNIFEKKMTLTSDVFLNLRTSKDVVR